ncbi:MAG: dihydrodipicolinate synthase family protein, partial [Firmicutes bacterium]|nr:dihydrodipicolinate synthase family protein [Bacillota bacterium]
MFKLKGIIPPMVTPLDRDKKVDEASTRRLVNFMLEAGVDGFFILGTMGEGLALSAAEKYRLVEIVLSEVRGKCPVIAGASDQAWEETVANVKQLERLGVDAVVVMQPPFFKLLSGEDIEKYFLAIAEATELPVVIYNHPSLTSNKIPLHNMQRLIANPRFAGVKDSSGDFDYLTSLLALRDGTRKEFSVLQGNEVALAPALLVGADGIVPGIGSLATRFVKQIYTAAEAGEKEQALNLQQKLNSLFDGIYGADVSDWLRGHKEALAYLGIIDCPETVYYQPLSAERKARVHAAV